MTEVLKIRRTTEGAATVFTVVGRLERENVSELREAMDAVAVGAVIVLDLSDLVLVDRDVIRLLQDCEARGRIVIRNCPAFIRLWMAAQGTQ